jgi:hypothetical protein
MPNRLSTCRYPKRTGPTALREFSRISVVAVVALVAACGGGGTTAAGTLTVTGGGIYEAPPDQGGCGGANESNRQFRGGAPVVVYDASGKVLGSGTLQSGYVEGPGSFCVLPFSFPLSGTDDNYQVQFAGGERVVVQDIEAVNLCFGPRCG